MPCSLCQFAGRALVEPAPSLLSLVRCLVAALWLVRVVPSVNIFAELHLNLINWHLKLTFLWSFNRIQLNHSHIYLWKMKIITFHYKSDTFKKIFFHFSETISYFRDVHCLKWFLNIGSRPIKMSKLGQRIILAKLFIRLKLFRHLRHVAKIFISLLCSSWRGPFSFLHIISILKYLLPFNKPSMICIAIILWGWGLIRLSEEIASHCDIVMTRCHPVIILSLTPQHYPLAKNIQNRKGAMSGVWGNIYDRK